MAYTLASALPKGGSTKSTVLVNVAAGFCRGSSPWKTLLVDLDAQGNASRNVGWTPDRVDPEDPTSPWRPTMTQVLEGSATAADVVRTTAIPNLDLLPAGDGLQALETQIVQRPGWDKILRKRLAPLQDEYDLICVDTPPNRSALTCNACVAADGVLMPCSMEWEAFQALQRLMHELTEWRGYTDAPMPVVGIVRSRVDVRRTVDRQVMARLVQEYGAMSIAPAANGGPPAISGGLVLPTVIPDSTVVPQAYGAGRDVAAVHPTSPPALAFAALVSELAAVIAAR